MRRIQVNYRVKLSTNFIFKNPLFSLLDSQIKDSDFDMQIITEDGEIVEDFSNSNLSIANSYEGSTTLFFKGNVKNENLKRYVLYGSYEFDYKPDVINISKIYNYALYETGQNNVFYCTRLDLQPFTADFFKEAEEVWENFLACYFYVYGVAVNAELVSVSLSEDGKVCKLVSRGFYRAQELDDKNDINRLNRILPS